MRNYLITALAAIILSLFGGLNTAEAAKCRDGSYATTAKGCPPPAAIKGPMRSTKKFQDECAWLPFPTRVRNPIVFLKQQGDDACIGKKWRSWCQDCVDWVQGKRGPVNGPARGARIVWRLHDNMGGISVPKSRLARIRKDAGWCDFGTTGMYDSNHF